MGVHPDPGTALDQTIAAERAIEDLYAEAFARWAPEVTPKVLPALGITAAAEPAPPPQQQELPPDPTAVTSTTSSTSWMTVAEVVIIAGIALLWAAAVVEAMQALAIPLPDLPEPEITAPPPDPRVLRIVNRAVPDMTPDDIIRADRIVAATPALAAAREQVLAEQRVEAQETLAVVQAKVESAVHAAGPRGADERAASAGALDPEGTALQDISRGKGYQAAGVLNQAVVTAAVHQNADIGEDLQKAWLCVHPDTVVSAVGVSHLARRHYDGAMYAIRTASGSAVSLTPQHRVLTGRGWVEAQFLHEGDDLLKVVDADTPGAPEVQDTPSTIGEIVDAAMDAAPAKVRTVRRGVDFDSDPGSRYVDVVATGGDLTINLESSSLERLRDLFLTDADRLGESVVLSGGRLRHGGGRLGPTAVLRGNAPIELSLVGARYPSGANLSGSGLIADLNASFREQRSDLSATGAVAISDRLGGFSGSVGRGDVAECVEKVSAPPSLGGELLSGAHLSQASSALGAKLPVLRVGAQDSTVPQASPDGFSASAECCSDVRGRLAGAVAGDDFVDVEGDPLGALRLDRIVAIECVTHDGFVYDLSTANHFYLADGLVAHNCTLDGKTRPTHWAADGQRVALTAKFKVGAAELEFPGDPTGPPAEVKNCRCRVGILAADEPLPDEVDRHTERLNGRDSTAVNRGGRTQAEEIARRRAAGNVRARDTTDGVGRVAAVNEETDMTDLVDLDLSKCSTVDEAVTAYESADLDPDFAAELTALVAASAVAEPRLRTYDPRLFEDPKLTRPTAPSMNNETGRIYGHLAEWGHTIRSGRDVTPRNRNGYRNFHTSQVQTSDGRQLSVGRLTVQGGHASTERGVTAAAARAHYDDVTTAFGLVRVGEDRFGIWFSGVPAPGVDPEVFQQGMTAQLSGDWRDCEGAPLDMIAAHAVNSPGFPIYSALTGPDGREMALVASLGPVRRSGAAKVLVVDDVRAIVAEEMAGERERAALAARRDAALTAAHAVVGDPPTPAEQVEELLMRAELVAAIGPGSQMPAQFKKYWLGGAGAAAIGWGKSGDFDRCRKLINAKIVENGQKPLPDHEISGLCASLHHEATGARPGHAPGEGGH